MEIKIIKGIWQDKLEIKNIKGIWQDKLEIKKYNRILHNRRIDDNESGNGI